MGTIYTGDSGSPKAIAYDSDYDSNPPTPVKSPGNAGRRPRGNKSQSGTQSGSGLFGSSNVFDRITEPNFIGVPGPVLQLGCTHENFSFRRASTYTLDAFDSIVFPYWNQLIREKVKYSPTFTADNMAAYFTVVCKLAHAHSQLNQIRNYSGTNLSMLSIRDTLFDGSLSTYLDVTVSKQLSIHPVPNGLSNFVKFISKISQFNMGGKYSTFRMIGIEDAIPVDAVDTAAEWKVVLRNLITSVNNPLFLDMKSAFGKLGLSGIGDCTPTSGQDLGFRQILVNRLSWDGASVGINVEPAVATPSDSRPYYYDTPLTFMDTCLSSTYVISDGLQQPGIFRTLDDLLYWNPTTLAWAKVGSEETAQAWGCVNNHFAGFNNSQPLMNRLEFNMGPVGADILEMYAALFR